ncbi:MAG: hypothetical protein MUD10_02705 [Candidatus Pacebacteria bacterium]|jgi:predicted RNA binding protein YcfA (HicA-like mRNA interferase family)|nr:hypothetical protein [Candidatus Paceibacterota bacterium]
MTRLKNWDAKTLKNFLKDYGFSECETKGSHMHMVGKIDGEDRIVQVIFSHKERDCQSNKTMRMAVKHSGIKQEYFEEWKATRKIHNELIS